MSTADSQSSFDLNRHPADPHAAGTGPAPTAAGIWLDGDVLACACPDCSAPMSIRLWLMVADCWRCGASLELTEEQERAALRLLEQQKAPPKPAPAAAVRPPAARPPAAKPPAPKPQAPPPLPTKPVSETASPRPSAMAAAIAPARPRPAVVPPVVRPSGPPGRVAAHQNRLNARLRERENQTEVDLFLRSMFRDLPAWIASLVIHLVLLIALAVWLVGEEDDKNKALTITLSTQTNERRREGDERAKPEPDPVEFEKPGDNEKIQDAPEEPKPALVEEPPEPEKPPRDPGKPLGNLPQPPEFAGAPGGTVVTPAMIASRTATARRELVKQEGGTSATEAAVARGLKWLARHQNDDGSWSLDNFHKAGDCRGRCGQRGFDSDVAGTALALLPFLGAGQTHLQGQYKEEVELGLRWLIRQQKANGDLPSPFRNSHMYAHGQGAIALCEAYALTRDELLREPAQRAVDFIVQAQHREGGWRYQPGERGDTSVLGWQLMALRSAQMGYLVVPPEAFELATRYLDAAQTDSAGAQYSYMPGNGESYVMTAEALLCRQYSGWPQNHPGLVLGARELLENHLPKPGGKLNMYYCYYATQVMHHMGGESWQHWNYRVRDLLVDAQETKGHLAGSWTPRVGHDDAGGRVYMTALAVCTLEVYYRHLPLYRQIAAEP